MSNGAAIVICLLAVGVFIWLLIPSNSAASSEQDAELINPNDPVQVGMLMGIYGGSIPDAAVLQYALDRFQREQGRRATTRDIGVVVGMIQAAP